MRRVRMTMALALLTALTSMGGPSPTESAGKAQCTTSSGDGAYRVPSPTSRSAASLTMQLSADAAIGVTILPAGGAFRRYDRGSGMNRRQIGSGGMPDRRDSFGRRGNNPDFGRGQNGDSPSQNACPNCPYAGTLNQGAN